MDPDLARLERVRRKMITWLLRYIKIEDEDLYREILSRSTRMCREAAEDMDIRDKREFLDFISHCIEEDISMNVLDALRDYYGLIKHIVDKEDSGTY